MMLNDPESDELDKGLIALIRVFMTPRPDREAWKRKYQIWNRPRDGTRGLLALLRDPNYFHLAETPVADRLRNISDEDLSPWVDRVLKKMGLDEGQ
jgi:hypothetical protein